MHVLPAPQAKKQNYSGMARVTALICGIKMSHFADEYFNIKMENIYTTTM